MGDRETIERLRRIHNHDSKTIGTHLDTIHAQRSDIFELERVLKMLRDQAGEGSCAAEIERLRGERDRAIEEHEARLCPEDVGCEELITALRSRVMEIEGALRRLIEKVSRWRTLFIGSMRMDSADALKDARALLSPAPTGEPPAEEGRKDS